MRRLFTGCAIATLAAGALAAAAPPPVPDVRTGALYLPATTSSSFGVVYQYVNARHGADAKGYLPFVHSYAPTNADGYNVFIGEDAGNFGGASGMETSDLCVLVAGSNQDPDSWRECYFGSYNVGIGREALHRVTSGYGNVAIGESSLKANTVGRSNVGVGNGALPLNTIGSVNTGLGANALFHNETGSENVAVGAGAMSGEVPLYNAGIRFSGSYNTAVGADALHLNQTGADYNAALGNRALYKNTTGHSNSALGIYAIYENTTGYENTALGYLAGYGEPGGSGANVTGNNNVWVGYRASGASADQANSIAIGAHSHATASNQAVFGNRSITNTQLYGSITVNGSAITVNNRNGVTAGGPGKTCVITEITAGVITGATCQ